MFFFTRLKLFNENGTIPECIVCGLPENFFLGDECLVFVCAINEFLVFVIKKSRLQKNIFKYKCVQINNYFSIN